MESSPPNKLFPNQRGFPTPNAAPDTSACRVFYIPADEEWLALLMGAAEALRNPYNWYQNGSLTQDEAAAAYGAILDAAYAQAETGQCDNEVQTPYWDDDTDVDDTATTELQQWFGFVTEPLAPPDELDFVESMVLWLFTGFVMASAGAGAAIAFKTKAPQFYITVRDTNIVELIRIIVDGEEMATVETPGTNSGEINVPIVADPEITDGHQIYLVKAS